MSRETEGGGRIIGFPVPPPPDEDLVSAVEALLFASGDPVEVSALAEALDRPAAEVRAALLTLERQHQGSGIAVERIAAGWQLRTAPRFAPAVHRLLGAKPQKLSRPALEVLSIVAYRQPVSRTEIDRLRGVDSGGVLKSLLDRGIVKTAGRSEDPGRPLLYRTTDTFLELFSLPDLAALPTLTERKELVRGQPMATVSEQILADLPAPQPPENAS